MNELHLNYWFCVTNVCYSEYSLNFVWVWAYNRSGHLTSFKTIPKFCVGNLVIIGT